MKTIILFSLFAFPVLAQNLPNLDQVAAGPRVECDEECTESCPQNIVRTVLNGNLTFMGRDLLPGSDQNRSCVFRGETAYVIYRNCMGNKHEAPATSITVIPFSGGSIDFYVENSGTNNGAISTMPRSQYDSTWRVSLANTPAPGQLNMDGVKSYLRTSQSAMRGGCYVGGTGGAQNLSARGACYGGFQNPQWLSSAESFWRDPGPNWNQTLQRLRTKVSSSY